MSRDPVCGMSVARAAQALRRAWAGFAGMRPDGQVRAHDLAPLRSLTGPVPEIRAEVLPNVAEVATAGGMFEHCLVVLDPVKLASLGIPHERVGTAIDMANREAGGAALENWARPS